MTDPIDDRAAEPIDLASAVPIDLDGDGTNDSLAMNADGQPGLDTVATPGPDGSLTVVSGLGSDQQLVAIDEGGDGTVDRAYLVEGGVTYAVDPVSGEVLGVVDPMAVEIPGPAGPATSATVTLPSSPGFSAEDRSLPIPMPRLEFDRGPDASMAIPMPSISVIGPERSLPVDLPAPSVISNQSTTIELAFPSSIPDSSDRTASFDLFPVSPTGHPDAWVPIPSPDIDTGDPLPAPSLTPVEGSVYVPPQLTHSPADLVLTELWHIDTAAERLWNQTTDGIGIPRAPDGSPRHADYVLTILRDTYTSDPGQKADLSAKISSYQQLQSALI